MNPVYASRLAGIDRLIEADVMVSNLDVTARRTLGALWVRRAQSELTASQVFAGLARDCSRGDVPAVVAELSERAVEDERFHAILSAHVAAHYLGAPPPEPVPAGSALRFESCDAALALGLRLILHSALNETVAAAYLRECHREAASPLMRAATRELLRDEIDHARIGWAYLASAELGPRMRENFCRELPALLSLVTRAWHEPLTEAEYPLGHGILSLERTREVMAHALKDLALPGLATFGLQTATH
jgi:hypothetical protein